MDPPNICSMCGFTTRNYAEFREHLGLHFGITARQLLKCPKCSFQDHSKVRFDIHMRVHNHETIFKCEICNRHFAHLTSFRRHKLRHDEKSLLCGICPLKFFTMQERASHLIQHYNQQNEFECLFKSCNVKFPKFSGLKDHLKNYHKVSGRNKMPCKTCDHELPSIKSLLYHVQTAHFGPKVTDVVLMDPDASDSQPSITPAPDLPLSTGSSIINTPNSTAIQSPQLQHTVPTITNLLSRSHNTASRNSVIVKNSNYIELQTPELLRTVALNGETSTNILAPNSLLICQHCDIALLNETQFLNHTLLHTTGHPLKCSICQIAWVNKIYFGVHSMLFHTV
ncbi:hypothetical protein CRE_21311 [Caenorhabditis remanei]|uniref:Uncharacterized protein n=1 Tax=Caenorhabditis remanei TaxID=31234 RepID=E3MUM4_CAERE|nr:hypothetical protein CRE_21311 [Caenorhabditis remanei]